MTETPIHIHLSAERARRDLGLRETWAYRDLALLFTRKALTVQYKQTVLGPLWVLITPLLSSLVYLLVFGNIAGLGTDGAPRLLFYLSGTALWGFFSACLTQNSGVFTANASLFGKVYFPRLTVPVSNVLTALVRCLIQLALVLVLLVFSRGAAPRWSALVVVPLLLLQLGLLGMGTGLLFSSLTAKYRDLAALISVGVQLWMFATPVVYPLSEVSGALRTVLLINPVTMPMELYRRVLLGVGTVVPAWLALSVGVTLLVALAGLAAFRHTEHDFIDTV